MCQELALRVGYATHYGKLGLNIRGNNPYGGEIFEHTVDSVFFIITSERTAREIVLKLCHINTKFQHHSSD